MVPKRKDTDASNTPLRKKSRLAPPANEGQDLSIPETEFDSEDADDHNTVEYTETGAKRAASEARRAWDYVCDFAGCGQRFNRPCRLEAHTRSHNKERPFVCPHEDCDKNFPRKDHLQRHLKNSHAEPERNFVCEWEGCGKAFTSSGRLQRHKDVHGSKFYCTGFPSCNEAFRKQKTLDAHVKSQHLEAKPYPCKHVDPETGERCTHGYQTDGGLRKHMAKAHEDAEEEGHFCMICIPPGTEANTIVNEAGETMSVPKEPLSFRSHDELLAHSREVHPPTCLQCGLKFKDQSGLTSHIQTVHSDPATQPQFHCPRSDCDGIFNRKHNLNVHIQAVHEKQYKFFCTAEASLASKRPDLQNWNGENACGAPFKAKSSLEQHIRTHHLGLQNRKAMRKAAKPRKQKPGPSALTLLTGIGYHKGREVPCLVQACEFRFFMDRDLRRHLRAAHNQSDADIEALLIERDAETGGQFWLGGIDDDEPMSLFESTEPSVPQTPMPYLAGHNAQTSFGKPGEQMFGMYDPTLDDLQTMELEDKEMDAAMGLSDLAPAVDVREGLQWDMLGLVEKFNWEGMQD